MDDYILTPENISSPLQKVKVIEIIDGDTIFVEFSDGKKEELNLLGIDAPEKESPKEKVAYF